MYMDYIRENSNSGLLCKLGHQYRWISYEEVLSSISKNYLNDETQEKEYKGPLEGEHFEVNPQKILANESLFTEKRQDLSQESTRLIILEAIEETRKHPEIWNKDFYTYIPIVSDSFMPKGLPVFLPFYSSVSDRLFSSIFFTPKLNRCSYYGPKEVRRLIFNQPYHPANWIEQSLEWGQRIVNGEEWETLCNKEDMVNYYRRIVVGKDEDFICIGDGYCNNLKEIHYSPTHIHKVNNPAYFNLTQLYMEIEAIKIRKIQAKTYQDEEKLNKTLIKMVNRGIGDNGTYDMNLAYSQLKQMKRLYELEQMLINEEVKERHAEKFRKLEKENKRILLSNYMNSVILWVVGKEPISLLDYMM